jgi:asparagine synthase (glutamine-hydrolysing)
VCGIGGIVSLDGGSPVRRTRLDEINQVLRHRGPDGAGVWTDRGVGLAHRRLAIIDLAGGGQPMPNEDRTAWLVCNGEIYNHAALRTRLERHGHRLRSRSDNEVILHLYEDLGDACVEQLDGMFAFALWDVSRSRLLLARDRLGIKPLYYALTADELLFGSEIKAILAAGGIRPSLNRAILPEFLATNFVSGEETFFEGVRKLLPGRLLTWSLAEGTRTLRYWRPSQPGNDTRRTEREYARELRARLEDAVSSHLMSDVPVGLFLSGGVDSGALAGLMARASSTPVRTFAIGVDEPRCNELPFAADLARGIGAEHRALTASRTSFFSALPRLVWHEDEPIAFPSSVLLHLVSKLAADDVKVMLSGEGADELFFGYNRYRATAWNQRLGSVYWALSQPRLRAAVKRSLERLPGDAQRYASRSFLALEPAPRELYCEPFSTFATPLWQELLLANGRDPRDPHEFWLSVHAQANGNLMERIGAADLETYLVELLMKQDQMSMAASIETRVPFLDRGVVELAAAIPASMKLRGLRTKIVLREAVGDLVPPEVLTRPKLGFPVPIGRWLRDGSSTLLDEFVLGERALARGLFKGSALAALVRRHREGAHGHGEQLWLLLNLELWQRIFVDGEPPEAISI